MGKKHQQKVDQLNFKKFIVQNLTLVMVCKGICSRYKAIKPAKNGRYEAGQKRCSICAIFLNWEGSHCPCCGYALRTKPKETTARHRLLLLVKRE